MWYLVLWPSKCALEEKKIVNEKIRKKMRRFPNEIIRLSKYDYFAEKPLEKALSNGFMRTPCSSASLRSFYAISSNFQRHIKSAIYILLCGSKHLFVPHIISCTLKSESRILIFSCSYLLMCFRMNS